MFQSVADTPDRIFDAYFKVNQKPLVWYQAKGQIKLGGLKRVHMELDITHEHRTCVIHAATITTAKGDDIEIAVTAQGLSFYRVDDPPGHHFGVMALSDEPPAPANLMREAIQLAHQSNDWRLVYVYEWAHVVDSARQGVLRPLAQMEPEGTRWRPVRPVYHHSHETIIQWGLFDLMPPKKDPKAPAEKPAVHRLCLTNMDGHPVKVEKKDDGSVVVSALDAKLPTTQRIDHAALSSPPPSSGAHEVITLESPKFELDDRPKSDGGTPATPPVDEPAPKAAASGISSMVSRLKRSVGA